MEEEEEGVMHAWSYSSFSREISYSNGTTINLGCEKNKEGESGKFPVYISSNVLDGSRLSVAEIS